MLIGKVWQKTVEKYFGEFSKNQEFNNFSIDYENKKILYSGNDIQLAESIVPKKYLCIGKRQVES